MDIPAARPPMITRWARRADRPPAALEPGYARLDERGFTELAAESAHFAGTLRYFGSDNTEDGDWETMLTADPSVLLALVGTLDVRERAEELRRLLRRLRRQEPPEEREAALHQVVAEVFGLARLVNRWLGHAERIGRAAAEEPAVALIERGVAELLGPRLRRLIGILAAAERAGFLNGDVLLIVADLHAGWRVELVEVEERPDWATGRYWLDRIAEPVSDAVDGFLLALENLTADAKRALDAGPEHQGHAPHVGLLFAFLGLFRHAQAPLNALPARIARFYHEGLMEERPRPARPDHVFIAARAAPGDVDATIPEGYLFEAGEDEAGTPVRFAADRSLPVTGARIDEVRLWRPEREEGSLRRLGVRAFGPEASAADFAGPLAAAELGLIVVGDALWVDAARSELTVTVSLTDVRWPADARTDGFETLLRERFRLSVASGDDWVDVPDFDTSGSRLEAEEASCVFAFTPGDLPRGGAGRQSGVEGPAVRLLLVQDPLAVGGTEVAPLAVFEKAIVDRVRVDLSVRDLRALEICTSGGAAGPVAALPPFGIPAAWGGWLKVSHPVLARGGLERIRLSLAWADLPPHPEGLAGYYREYVVGLDRELHRFDDPLFTNQVFRVRLETPLGSGVASAEFPLFPGADAAGPLPPVSTFELAADLAEDVRGTDRALRLTLTEPGYAFGDVLYPVNVAHATAAAAQEGERERGRRGPIAAALAADERLARRLGRGLKRTADVLLLRDGIMDEQDARDEEEVEQEDEEEESRRDRPAALESLAAWMPNPPWRPSLVGLTLDFDAHYETGGGRAEGALKLLHCLPLDPPEPAAPAPVPLLAGLPEKAHVDLAVSGWREATPLSLLFVLRSAGDEAHGPVEWLIGGSGGWRGLAPAEVEDGTGGFCHAGIVTLHPGTGTLRRIADASGRALIRASIEAPLPRLRGLFADALCATRVIVGDETNLVPVPAETIATLTGVAGVAGAEQPLASWGGMASEPAGTLAARAGERLRHKERPITAWDHERLLLDRFPELEAVRVLPARGPDGLPQPGALLAIVLPAAADPAERPRLRAAQREAMADALRAVSSPFAAISVVQADWVAVHVTADVFLPKPRDVDRLRQEVGRFLSPAAAEGPGLPDGATEQDLGDAVLRFIRTRSYVAGVGDVTVELASQAEPRAWLVPVAGNIEIHTMARESLGV
jgi:hypothetical protein